MKIIRQLLFICATWCFFDIVCTAYVNSDAFSAWMSNFNECGKSTKVYQRLEKIAGGRYAVLGSWPWMVALYYTTGRMSLFWCAGSLISREWAITAGHCIHRGNLFIRVGDLDLDDRVDDGASPKFVPIDIAVPHPQFDEFTLQNDIGLLHLKNAVNFTETVRPICLLSGQEYLTNEYYDRKEAFIIGWGDLSDFQHGPSHLLETTVRVTPLETCAKQYAYFERLVINEKLICASAPGRDTCKSDSGGPFMFFNETNGRFYLGGITSGGNGCTHEEFPGVYTKIAQYIPWINQVTGLRF